MFTISAAAVVVVVVVVAAAEPVKGFDCDDVDGNFMMFRFTIRLLVKLFLETCSHCLKCPHRFDLRIFSFKKNFLTTPILFCNFCSDW